MTPTFPERSQTEATAQPRGAEAAVSLATSVELDRGNLVAPVAFAAVYALASLLVLPWQWGAAWLTTIVAWEVLNRYVAEPHYRSLPEKLGFRVFAAENLTGTSVYCLLALASLATGSPLGIALGATWLCGVYINAAVYYGENRLLLASTLAPPVSVAVVGPSLAHGVNLAAMAETGLLLLPLLATREFLEGHKTLMGRLEGRLSALTSIEHKLAMAIEASGDGMFEVDLISGVHDVSPGWASMLGYEREALNDVRLLNLVHPDDFAHVRAELDRHFRDETPHTTTEQRMRCADGSYKWVLTRSRLIERTATGEPWRVIGTTVDLSKRKAMELQLEAARDAAERANAAKSMFVANMSHEIRTPLNGVIGVAGVLARSRLTKAQRDMVGLVQSSAQVLERLMTDVLDQSKLEAGEFELEIAPFDLRRAVEDACELMRPRASEKGLGFVLTYEDAAEGVFRGDGVRLRQIICNLAANAIKFTETGEVSVAVSAVEGEPSERTQISIAVSDTGIGFDAATADRLFGRFVQADGSIARRFGGSGLGLSISRALAELMGGTISATSTPGVGSRFLVVVPLRRDAAPAQQGAMSVHAFDDEGLAFEGLRVLVAEDHPTNQQVIRLMLAPVGAELTIVEDGQAALDAFAPGAFDVVLMDMQMPRMDGLTATRAIRQREAECGAARTPIAMLTANAMEEHRAQGLAAGADSHIAKPITPQSLYAGIAALISTGAAMADVDAA